MQFEKGKLAMALPVLLPTLEEHREYAVQSVLNAYRAQQSDRELRDAVAELNVLEQLRVKFKDQAKALNEEK